MQNEILEATKKVVPEGFTVEYDYELVDDEDDLPDLKVAYTKHYSQPELDEIYNKINMISSKGRNKIFESIYLTRV